ncbi:MAG: helix-turn-helix transcriptional regulator [Candidatus Thermoplasmatota archaeon]|nr:helix-turn-helix transcriptional regulator [Candidatus Thermoplasmatota archaeon]
MHEECTVYRTIDLVAKKWSMVILLEIYRSGGGPKRFTEIKNGLCDITPKVLSQRLKELEEAGLLTKEVDASKVPIKAEYDLTPSGVELIEVVKQFKCWALKWKVDNKVCEKLDCRECRL